MRTLTVEPENDGSTVHLRYAFPMRTLSVELVIFRHNKFIFA